VALSSFEEMKRKKGVFLGGRGGAAMALSSFEEIKKKKGVFPREGPAAVALSGFEGMKGKKGVSPRYKHNKQVYRV
jgi:hypothetical protein